MKLTEEDIIVICRLEAECTYDSSKNVLVVNAFDSEEESEQLKQQILNDQKLRELIEKRIEVFEKLSDSDYKGIDFVQDLKELLEESKK